MPISALNGRNAEIPASHRKSESRNTMVMSHFRPEVEIRQSRARAFKNMQYIYGQIAEIPVSHVSHRNRGWGTRWWLSYGADNRFHRTYFQTKIVATHHCIIYTARRSYANAVLGVVILCACPSVTCVLNVTNPKNLPAIFFIPHERAILLVFCHPTPVGGRRPLQPKMGDRSDPPPSKIVHVHRFPPVTFQQ